MHPRLDRRVAGDGVRIRVLRTPVSGRRPDGRITERLSEAPDEVGPGSQIGVADDDQVARRPGVDPGIQGARLAERRAQTDGANAVSRRRPALETAPRAVFGTVVDDDDAEPLRWVVDLVEGVEEAIDDGLLVPRSRHQRHRGQLGDGLDRTPGRERRAEQHAASQREDRECREVGDGRSDE